MDNLRWCRLIWALVTEQETATTETALCAEHLKSESARSQAIASADTDVDVDRGFVDCSGNDQLACIVCGNV